MPHKRLFSSRFIFLVFLILGACNDSAEKQETSIEIFQSYRDKGSASLLSIPPGLASIFLDEEQAGGTELLALLKDIKKLTFLIIPNASGSKENVCYSDINTRLNRILFRDLATINSGNEIITIKILSKDCANAEEMVVIVSNYQNLFCISFQGDISLAKVANLTQPDNIKVVSNLNRFNR